jgi:hypothetical protein
MEDNEKGMILAVVTRDPAVVSGGAPIFIGCDEEQCASLARSLSRIMDAMAHYLDNDTYIIVSH